METHKEILAAEKLALLKQFGTECKPIDDPIFKVNNQKIFPPFIRRGVSSFDDENLYHKSNHIRCNVPSCRQEFDTVFAYESHYNALHRFPCNQCSKQLPSAHLLDLHLSEKHDSFFAVQSEKKPMFACFLEECTVMSKTPAERHDHCIRTHKFPHDYRFDGYNHNKKNGQSSGDSNNSHPQKATIVRQRSEPASMIEASEFISNQVHDEDDVLEDKSILLLANQRKPIASFSFGHKKSKTFNSLSSHDKSYAKQLTKKSRNSKKHERSALEGEKMVVDLLESLPCT